MKSSIIIAAKSIMGPEQFYLLVRHLLKQYEIIDAYRYTCATALGYYIFRENMEK